MKYLVYIFLEYRPINETKENWSVTLKMVVLETKKVEHIWEVKFNEGKSEKSSKLNQVYNIKNQFKSKLNKEMFEK